LYEILEKQILDWYDRISQYVTSDEKNWFYYIKNYEVKCESNGSISGKPLIAYIPYINPFLSFKHRNGEHIAFKELFDISEKIIHVMKCYNVEIPYEPQVRRATRELILLAFENSQHQLPSKDEIKKRIIDNVDHLFYRSIEKVTKVRSIAPIIGCTLTDSLLLGDVTFRNPTEQDLALIMMAQQKSPFELPKDPAFFRHPVLVLDHNVNMQPDPNRYSIEESLRILHIAFKVRVRDALFAIRLGSQADVGFSSVFHIDSEWITPESLRLLTEEPYSTYKTVVAGTTIPKLSTIMPRIALQKQPIEKIFHSLKTVRDKREKDSVFHLDLAIRRFDQALSRNNPEDQLIDLVISLETLALISQELSFRLALWTAVIAGTDDKSRHEIYKDIKKAYDLRNKIVHGEERPEEKTVREYALKTRSHFCSVFRKLLQILPEKKLETIKKELPERIFRAK